MVKRLGGECRICRTKEQLEFAHREREETNGEGRGSYLRIKEVMNHPEKFVLLCSFHHGEYDEFAFQDIEEQREAYLKYVNDMDEEESIL